MPEVIISIPQKTLLFLIAEYLHLYEETPAICIFNAAIFGKCAKEKNQL